MRVVVGMSGGVDSSVAALLLSVAPTVSSRKACQLLCKRQMATACLTLAALALGLLSPAAHAGSYAVIKGNDLEVCRAYAANLNSFHPPLPMRCERKVNPELTSFAKPAWTRLDEWNGVIEKIDDFVWRRDVNPAYYLPLSEWRGTDKQYVRARQIYERDRWSARPAGHLVSNVDIDNDGTTEPVYLDRACGTTFGASMLVLTPDQTDIDYKKTALVMRHPSRKAAGLGELRPLASGEQQRADVKGFPYTQVEDAFHWAFYDVFQFKGKAYFDLWWTRHPAYRGRPDYEAGELHVFFAKGREVREVCTLHFDINK